MPNPYVTNLIAPGSGVTESWPFIVHPADAGKFGVALVGSTGAWDDARLQVLSSSETWTTVAGVDHERLTPIPVGGLYRVAIESGEAYGVDLHGPSTTAGEAS